MSGALPAWRPVVVDRAALGEDGWRAFLADHPVWQTHDTLNAQLLDLVRARHPRKVDLSEAECAPHVAALLDGAPPEGFGRWVYYPWSGRLVHLLPPDLFRELRTDRNRYKVTADEQARLDGLTVGVAGLSVGNVIAVTLAQERVVGHLKLADFDHLELSNLNRIRAGVQHLGVPKVVVAARQIFELDPYTSLEVFPDGLTPDNLDAFLVGDRPLDVLIDECDGIQVKFLLRERARAHRVPVLMETSDRGMLDIERFDLEPDRPLFHGLVGDVPAADLVDIDSERKATLMLAIIGADTTTPRAAASLIEIDRSISSWPQLASDVTLGGATVPKALRRIALGQPLASGRLYVDVDRQLVERSPQPPPASRPPPLPQPGLAATARPLDGIPPEVVEVVRCATLAPSGGNCQPWAFRWDGQALWVLHDAERSANLLDGRRHASLLAIGAALENVRVAAEHLQLRADVRAFPSEDQPQAIARVTLVPGGPPTRNTLRERQALEQRVTNRRLGRPEPLGGAQLLGLLDAARSRGAQLELCVNRRAREQVGAILGAGERLRSLAAPLHRELFGEVRMQPVPQGSQQADGIGVDELELTAFQRAGMRVLSRTDVVSHARQPGRGRALEEGARDAAEASAAMALLCVHGDAPADWLRAGHAIQRVWLAATATGLAMQPMTALLYMFEVAADRPEVYTDAEHAELQALQARLRACFPASRHHTPAFLFRLAHADPPTQRSGRQPLERVLGWGDASG